MKKKAIIILALVSLTILTTLFTVVYRQAVRTLQSSTIAHFNFDNYKKGWQTLEYFEFIPILGSIVKKHQESAFLRAKISFYWERYKCQSKAENSVLEELSRQRASTFGALDSTHHAYFSTAKSTFSKWRNSEETTLSVLLQESNKYHSKECFEYSPDWQNLLDWSTEHNRVIPHKDSILPSNSLVGIWNNLYFKYNTKYLFVGY
jgi:hypothetical protein